MTSAPRSLSCSVAHGPAPNCSTARTRMSDSGACTQREANKPGPNGSPNARAGAGGAGARSLTIAPARAPARRSALPERDPRLPEHLARHLAVEDVAELRV